jgi:hypothetical protein
LDPVSTGGLDAVYVGKREGLRECHRPARCPSCHFAVPVTARVRVGRLMRFDDLIGHGPDSESTDLQREDVAARRKH